jgi:hypothetical protein
VWLADNLLWVQSTNLDFERVAYGQLYLIDDVPFTPTTGVTGTTTPLTFSGDSADGDFVVIAYNNCSAAHLSLPTTELYLSKQPLISSVVYYMYSICMNDLSV